MTYIDKDTVEWASNLLGYRRGQQPYTETNTAPFARPAWHADAARRGMGHDRWFPKAGDSTVEAIAICNGCPVQAECLKSANEHDGPVFGIWGGMTGRQRNAYRPRRRAA